MLDQWTYVPGLPANAVHVKSATLATIDKDLTAFNGGASAASIDGRHWSTQEWLRFLNGLPRQQSAARLAELDRAYGLSASPNAYVQSAWFVLAIANRYEPVVPSLDRYLHRIGRGLLIFPLYNGLKAQDDWGLPIARRIYATARATYHPTIAGALDKRLAK
jgi:hypothetical protein